MVDSEPESNKEQERKGFRNEPYSAEIRDFLRRHRSAKAIGKSFTRLLVTIGILFTEQGREAMKDPANNIWGVFFKRERQVGLLEDSILNPELYHPNQENTSLELSKAAAGRWVGYDFHRPQEFKLTGRVHEKQKKEGRLITALLSEVEDNAPDEYTPTTLLDIFDLEHVFSMDFPTIETTVEQGLIRQTTYGDAYTKVGLYEKYRLNLHLTSIVDKPVYIVTPKGNSIVGLAKDGGKKQRLEKRAPQLKPAYQV